MSLATPTVALTDWIASQLAAQSDLAGVGVFVAVAPDGQPRPVAGAAGPYVTLRVIDNVDWYFLGGRLGGTNSVVEVTAWDEGTDTTRLAPLAAAIQAALQRQRGTSGDVTIVSCVRAAPVERQITEGDGVYTQIGGDYRLRASAA